MNETALRSELVRYGRLMYERGLTYATGGNLSARLDEHTILVTRSGVRKGEMVGRDLLVVDLRDGSHRGVGRPSIETPLHTVMYSRPEVGAVVHGHPIHCTALAVMGRRLLTGLVPEGVMVLGEVPLVPYRTPGTEDLARAMQEAGGDGKGYLMEKHGALTTGPSLEEAFTRLEEMELIATVQIRCMALGTPQEIPEEERERIGRI